MFPRAEPANSRCSGRVQPGAAALMAWCLHESGVRGPRNLGIYNCRAIRGSQNRSVHGDGRAIDVGFSGHSNPEGWKLVERLLPHVGKLGIQRIIWARRIWDAKAPAGRYYSGAADHYDHVHIELTWAAAYGLNLPTIRAAMRGLAPAVQPAPPKPQPGPPPEPDPPEEDDDMPKPVVIRHHGQHGHWLHEGRQRTKLDGLGSTQADRDNIQFWTFLCEGRFLDYHDDPATSARFLRHSVDISEVSQTALRSTWLQTVVGRIAEKLGVKT